MMEHQYGGSWYLIWTLAPSGVGQIPEESDDGGGGGDSMAEWEGTITHIHTYIHDIFTES